MSGSEPHSGLDVPPGFNAASPKAPKPSNPVPSDDGRTIDATGGGSLSAFPDKFAEQPISRAVICEDHQSVSSGDASGDGQPVTRKRAKPQFFDPTPLPTRKRGRGRAKPQFFHLSHMPTRKRGRGRPPSFGRKPRLISWFAYGGEPDLERNSGASLAPLTRLRKQSDIFIPPSVRRSEENRPSSPSQNQSGEQSIHANTLLIIHERTEQQIQNIKREARDVTGNGQPSVVNITTACAQQETTTTPPLPAVPTMANVSQYDREREGPCVLNSQSTQSIDSFMRHVVNAFDDSGESNPAADGTTAEMGYCAVNPSLAPTLEAIIKKHGDIAKDCSLKSACMRICVLEGICKIVQELQGKEFAQLDITRLNSYYSALEDAQSIKLNVKWLRERLDEIFGVVNSIVNAKNLTDQKALRMERIEYLKKELQLNKVELEKLKSDIDVKESQLALETMENIKLNNTIRGMASKFQNFRNNSVMDGLL